MHPCSPGSRWSPRWLETYADPELRLKAIEMRQLLNTEVDALLLAPDRAVVIECKYHGHLSREQIERQRRMISVLKRRLTIEAQHVLVTETDRRPRNEQISIAHITWQSIDHWLQAHPSELF